MRRGLHTWSIFDPLWADPALCLPDETMLACEFRLHNPSVLIIRLGSNDAGVPDAFERNLRRVVEFTIEQGVIPILGTKADRFDGPSDINNTIIRQLATEYHVPLWDFDRVAATIPGRGLGPDAVHLTINFAHDWSSPAAMSTGHGVHNITALMMLDTLWSVINQETEKNS